jgi:hypothetical protein
VVSQQPRKTRRAPRFPAFLVTGGLVGLVTGLSLGAFGPDDPRYEVSAAMGFLGLFCAALGVLVAGIVAVLLDRRS